MLIKLDRHRWVLEGGRGRVNMTGLLDIILGSVAWSEALSRITASGSILSRVREKAIANKIRGRSQGDPGAAGGQPAAALRRLQGLWI